MVRFMRNMESTNFTYLSTESLENLDKEDSKYIKLSKEITKDIKNKKLLILDIVKKLEYLLVNVSYAKREIGVLILCEVLKELDANSLNSEQLALLCSYFVEKLKDHHQVATSALKGVFALVSFPNCPNESVIQLITTIFNHITCQQQQQQDRYIIYQIYETVLKGYKEVIDMMGVDWVYGIISSIDGERDPKNLIYLFKWLQAFLKSVKLAHLTEEMFDVLACYFPVDFKAPPSDNIKISRGDLAQSLCQCLSCIPDFGPHALPLALEKLDSALRIAKEDSLDILKEGCRGYLSETYNQFFLEIWNQLQKDIFSTKDEELKQKCLDTLEIIIRKLSSTEDQNAFRKIIADVIHPLKQNLQPDSKVFCQTVKMLLSVAQASGVSSLLVAKIAGGFLGTSYQITTDSVQKSQQLSAYIAFIKSAVNNNEDFTLNRIEETASAPTLCLQAVLKEDLSLRNEGLKGFTEIVSYIPEDVRNILFVRLKELIFENQDKSSKRILFLCLAKMAEHYPQEVNNNVLYKNQINNSSELNRYINFICNSLVNITFFEDYLVSTLSYYAVRDVNSSIVALGHLNYFLQQNDRFQSVFLETNFVSKLTDFLREIHSQDEKWLFNVNEVLTILIRCQDNETQKELYVNESNKSYQDQLVYISVLSGLIIGLKRTNFQDYNKIEFLLNSCLNSSDSFLQNVSLQTVASILNKINEDIVEEVLRKIEQLSASVDESRNIKLVSWVTKGLVTRNHACGWTWTDKLLDQLYNNIDNSLGFRIIMDDTLSSLSRQNNCIIMPLYKQKFFVYVTNKLSESNVTDKPSYYNTIGYLIENASKQTVIGQFKKIIKLVFLCLERCNEPVVLEILLLRITEFIRSKESVIENNLEDILLRILNLTTFESSMKVRIAAINSLKEFTGIYQIYKLVPFQQRVIKKLGSCIDDKKRMVRKEATECRCLWFLLDAPL